MIKKTNEAWQCAMQKKTHKNAEIYRQPRREANNTLKKMFMKQLEEIDELCEQTETIK